MSASPRSKTELKKELPLLHKLYGDKVFIFHVWISPEEVYIRNLKRHRKDLPELDTRKIIKKRLDTFNKYTLPVIKLLEKQKKIIEINGEQPIMPIHKDILKALEKQWQITIKTKEEIEILKEGGKILAEVLKEIGELAKPGVSTGFLNQKAREMILARGALPSFEGYKPSFSGKPYPAAICASLNSVIVHGVPSEKIILKKGDILKIDIGVKYKNLFTDAAITVGIGKITEEKQKLIDVTLHALELAIAEVKAGIHIGDIGFVIENYVGSQGLSVIKTLVGHGVGYAVHEEPNIPNYGEKGEGPELKPGMILAIEPMVALGSGEINQSKDDFGYETIDGSFSAHFEHTVAVTDEGHLILTELAIFCYNQSINNKIGSQTLSKEARNVQKTSRVRKMSWFATTLSFRSPAICEARPPAAARRPNCPRILGAPAKAAAEEALGRRAHRENSSTEAAATLPTERDRRRPTSGGTWRRTTAREARQPTASDAKAQRTFAGVWNARHGE